MSNSAIDELIRILDIETISETEFYGPITNEDWQRVFGGQVIAQGLLAACKTIDNNTTSRMPHSLHAYFIRPGNPKKPIKFSVNLDRDGHSFSVRRVCAIQDDKIILNMACSFHINEDENENTEILSHQFTIPNVPPPETLKDEVTLYSEMFQEWEKEGRETPPRLKSMLLRPRSIEFRPISQDRYLKNDPQPPHQAFWFRLSAPISENQILQRAALAYSTDMMLLSSCLLPHGIKFSDSGLTVASLDHALWFHEDVNINDWLLYVQDSPWSGHARGMNRGTIYDKKGTLIASVAQEALIRKQKGRNEPAQKAIKPENLYYGD